MTGRGSSGSIDLQGSILPVVVWPRSVDSRTGEHNHLAFPNLFLKLFDIFKSNGYPLDNELAVVLMDCKGQMICTFRNIQYSWACKVVLSSSSFIPLCRGITSTTMLTALR